VSHIAHFYYCDRSLPALHSFPTRRSSDLIDANPLGNGYYTYKQRKFAIWTFIFGFIILWVSMIVIGTLIRGPGWMWFWPGMTWRSEEHTSELQSRGHVVCRPRVENKITTR